MLWSDYAITSVKMWGRPFSELWSWAIFRTAQQYVIIAQSQTLNFFKKIQERALRYVTNDYKSDYRSLLCQTSLPSLEEGRQQQIAIQTFKIANNLSPPYLKYLITPRKCTQILRNPVKTLEIPFYNRVDTEQIHFHCWHQRSGTIYQRKFVHYPISLLSGKP